MVEVYKFGGTSVGGAARMLGSAEIVRRGPRPLVVVASAMSGVTDALVRLGESARRGEGGLIEGEVAALLARHLEAIAAMEARGASAASAASARARCEGICEALASILTAAARLGELTARSRDRVLACGEQLSAPIFALGLEAVGLAAVALDAAQFLETDDQFGEANPLSGIADRTLRAALEGPLSEGKIPVVTGFCGRAPDGATTTLGRGGSDLSATVIGAALGARAVTLWSDVDGVYSADPRVVPEARVIPQLHFREAAEMSFYGAKVLHQRTMMPVAPLEIPVWSRNSMRPEAPGTVVDGRFTPGSHPVKAVTAVRGQALLSVEGKGMSGVPGVSARLFGALAERGISVTMISQSSSEASICLVVPDERAEEAEGALKRAFRDELARGAVEEVVTRRGVGLVAAVGLGMAQTPGVSARLFGALAARGVNVLAIAQGSSELNISLALDAQDIPEALRAAHGAFGLDRIDTGEDAGRRFDVLLVGPGKVGRRVLELLEERREAIGARVGLWPRVVGLADRGGWLVAPAGLSSEALREALAHKAAGGALAALSGGQGGDPGQMLEAAMSYRRARPVLVDVSDGDGAEALFARAFALGADVVTANKKPLAGALAGFDALLEAASRARGLLKAEATVGAGLPVMDTLETLLAAGDQVQALRGCFSGTLGFVMTRLEEGAALSVAVQEAREAGYTEPDPAVDLSGADVARKAIILGRLSGLARQDGPLALEGLVGPDLVGKDWLTLLGWLKGQDEAVAARVSAAKAAGRRLRFVASVTPGRIEVGPREVPAESALGMLSGTDNMVVFVSERYAGRPLVISGPGAGVDVTAMGVLGDILRIAAQRS